MRLGSLLLFLAVSAYGTLPATAVQQNVEPQNVDLQPTKPSTCLACHGESELWEGDRLKLHVTEQHLVNDVHWQQGLRCHDCHGGDSTSTNFLTAHAEEAGFRTIKSPVDVPAFCGHCHSNIDYMRQYVPSPRTDQEAEYWTSGHGMKLKSEGAGEVATCVSCHGHHGILEVANPQAAVHPNHVAETCATCHSNAELMADREYNGKPLGHQQFELWSKSVHATALLKNGDISAATCNDCHGNHGAIPPDVTSVANACGSCHVKVADLFAKTKMKHSFEKLDLPGCVTCHGNHEIRVPTDDMLGMESNAVCSECHQNAKYGATFAGAEVAKLLRRKLDDLKRQIARCKETVAEAEHLGMEVRGPKFDLIEAESKLTNARTLVHSFAAEPMGQTLDEGLQITAEIQARADDALGQYTYRRIWLAASTLPILLVVVLLLLYIRALPVPT